jgi:hypothetical protein
MYSRSREYIACLIDTQYWERSPIGADGRRTIGGDGVTPTTGATRERSVEIHDDRIIDRHVVEIANTGIHVAPGILLHPTVRFVNETEGVKTQRG